MPMVTRWEPRVGEKVEVTHSGDGNFVITNRKGGSYFLDDQGPFWIEVVKTWFDEETGRIVHGRLLKPEHIKRVQAEADTDEAVIKFFADEVTVEA